jgi:hypothetical protein
MSRGLGKMQTAILERLRLRAGGDEIDIRHEPEIRLAAGIHDVRQVAREMTLDTRGFSDPSKAAAFSRALEGLIERGLLRCHTMVPLASYSADGKWASRVHDLANGLHFDVPPGPQWRRRFVSIV